MTVSQNRPYRIIEIARNGGDQYVLAWETDIPGLVVAWANRGWSVTHEASGRKIGDGGMWCCRPHAMRWANRLRGPDWTLPTDELIRHSAHIKELIAAAGDKWPCGPNKSRVTLDEVVAILLAGADTDEDELREVIRTAVGRGLMEYATTGLDEVWG